MQYPPPNNFNRCDKNASYIDMNIYEEVAEEKYIDELTQESAVLYERNVISLFFLNL